MLEACREYLEPGSNVVLTVKVDPEGEGVKLLANGVEPIDRVAAKADVADIRIHIDRAEAVTSIALLLGNSGDRSKPGRITLCVPDEDGREIDLLLPDPYPVSPQVRGAIKAMQGVVMVEEV